MICCVEELIHFDIEYNFEPMWCSRGSCLARQAFRLSFFSLSLALDGPSCVWYQNGPIRPVDTSQLLRFVSASENMFYCRRFLKLAMLLAPQFRLKSSTTLVKTKVLYMRDWVSIGGSLCAQYSIVAARSPVTICILLAKGRFKGLQLSCSSINWNSCLVTFNLSGSRPLVKISWVTHCFFAVSLVGLVDSNS